MRSKVGHIYTLDVALKPGSPNDQVAIEAGKSYRVVVWVIPKLGANAWRFDIVDGSQYPINTNDGKTGGFNPVEKLQAFGYTVRSPPRATIDVNLKIDIASADVKEMA